MVGIPGAISSVQEIVEEISPAPVTFKRISSAKALKNRLNWGKPDLTIIDVRDRQSYNQERITGAILMSAKSLLQQGPPSLETNRDIYVYGATDESAINAAAQLDAAGFNRVAILAGGLNAWKDVHGSTEGRLA